MNFLLDTDTISHVLDKKSPYHTRVTSKLSEISDKDNIFISVLSIYETEYGIAVLKNDVNKEKYEQARILMSEVFKVLPVTEKAAKSFGNIKARYQDHTGIHSRALARHNVDLIIAATAIEQEAVLVASDKIYSKLIEAGVNINFENWAL